MSEPRVLYANVVCARCNNVRRSALQFHTSQCDDGERYESGEIIDDPALPCGSVFEASLWCYCDDCMGLWKVDQSTTYYEALAHLAHSERIFVRRGGEIVEPDDLLVESRSPEEHRGGVPNLPAWLSERKLSIHPPTRLVVGGHEDVTQEYEAIDRLCDAAMRKRGWPLGGEFIRFDADVRVSDDDRITHDVPSLPNIA